MRNNDNCNNKAYDEDVINNNNNNDIINHDYR